MRSLSRIVILALGALAAAALAAPGARSQGAMASAPDVAPAQPAASAAPTSKTAPASLQVSFRAVSRSQREMNLVKPAAVAGEGFTAERAEAAPAPGPISEMRSAFQESGTPFLSEVQVSIMSLWRGHLRLDGIESSMPMDSILWGLPGAGTVGGFNPSDTAHSTVHVPREDIVRGFRLTVRFRGDPGDPMEYSCARGARWLMRAGRDAFHR